MDTTNLVAKDSSLNNVAYIYEKFLWSEGQLVFVFVNSPPGMYKNQRNNSKLKNNIIKKATDDINANLMLILDVSTATGQHDMLDLVDRW